MKAITDNLLFRILPLLIIFPFTINAWGEETPFTAPPDPVGPPSPPELRAYVTVPDHIERPAPDREQMWWWNQFIRGKLNINDPDVIYPPFLKFCLDVYKWGDRFFNSYDPEYVVGTGKRWKARVVNDNWADSYLMNFPNKMDLVMSSDVYANIGAYIQYMAVSLGYSWDINTVFRGRPLDHKKWEFGFNCALFDIALYYQENDGGTNLRKFGEYNGRHYFKKPFTGVNLWTAGIDAIYFFNHKRYSHGAAYNFSKFQKRSQGSWIIGFFHTNLKVNFDFNQLPTELLPYLTVPADNYVFHYNSYSLTAGYGYNWVIKPKLLFNVTILPSFGITHCYEDSLEGAKYMPAVDLSARNSLTYNLGNFFFSAIYRQKSHWYKSGTYSLVSSVHNFSANIGFRF